MLFLSGVRYSNLERRTALPSESSTITWLCALPGVRRPTIVTPACCMMQANTSAAQVVFSLTRTTIGILRYELPDE